jgi:hypothetical protein
MPTTTDFLILYGLLACIALYPLLKFLSKTSFKSRKRILLSRYKALRKESLRIQEAMSMHILSGNADRELLTGEITYGEYYRRLKHNHVSHLSSKIQEKLQNSDNPLLLIKTVEELNEQEKKLKEAQSLLSGILAH